MIPSTFFERQFALREQVLASRSRAPGLPLPDVLALHALCEVVGAKGVLCEGTPPCPDLSSFLNAGGAAELVVVHSRESFSGLGIDASIRALSGFEFVALVIDENLASLPKNIEGRYCRSLRVGPSLWNTNIGIASDADCESSLDQQVIKAIERLYKDTGSTLFGLMEEVQRLRRTAGGPPGQSVAKVTERAGTSSEIARLKREIALLQYAVTIAHKRMDAMPSHSETIP